MNKKLFMLIGVIVCMAFFMFSAYGEEFVLHSDVAFGMSSEEVIAKEKENGFDAKRASEIDNTIYSQLYRTYTEDGLVNVYSDPLVVKGRIAGIDDTFIKYFFNDEDVLIRAIYTFGGSEFEQKDADFSRTQESLEGKYDASQWTYDELELVSTINEEMTAKYFHDPSIYHAAYTVFPFNNGEEIHINHVLGKNTVGNSIVYGHFIDYCYFTKEETQFEVRSMADAMSDAEERSQELEDDL